VRPRPFAIVLMAVALVTACDGDDGSDEELRALIADDLVASQQDGAISFDEEQAACVADGLVDGFGSDQLRAWGYDEEAGQTPEGDLTIEDPDQREDAWDVLVGCVDVTEQIAGILAAGGSLEEQEATCVAEQYVASDVAAHAVFGPGDAEVNEQVDQLLAEAVEDCS
jgi:hypothetical protein